MADVLALIRLPPPPAPPAPLSAAAVLDEASLGRLLGALASRPGPLPKYHYPSAGTLYPVQTYLVLRRAVGSLAAGSYYYDPQAHALAPLSPQLPSAPDGSLPDLWLLLAAQLAAIEPVYHAESEAFCLIEGGYISEALRQAGAGLALRDAGDPAVCGAAGFAAAFDLDAGHRPLLALAIEEPC
ncbi:MAG: hypothetical protein ACM3JG_20910 [Thiohalocapsa sp.]